jgi:hypothetical protein
LGTQAIAYLSDSNRWERERKEKKQLVNRDIAPRLHQISKLKFVGLFLFFDIIHAWLGEKRIGYSSIWLYIISPGSNIRSILTARTCA